MTSSQNNHQPQGGAGEIDNVTFESLVLLLGYGPQAFVNALVIMGPEKAKQVNDNIKALVINPDQRESVVRRIMAQFGYEQAAIDDWAAVHRAEALIMPRHWPAERPVYTERNEVFIVGREIRIFSPGYHDQSHEALLLQSIN